MTAIFTATLHFSFFYGNLDPEIIKLFNGSNALKNILLEFNQQ